MLQNKRGVFVLLSIMSLLFCVNSKKVTGSSRTNVITSDNSYDPTKESGFDFPCPSLPPHTPKGIRDLRPDDIGVMLALGDSITAGFGITGWLGGPLTEHRGLSFSIGGDAGAVTLPNFFRNYNPNITGFSVGDHLISRVHEPDQDHLNAARSGATVEDLTPYEVQYLVDMFNNSASLKNEWKVLTLFIGANDLCGSCQNDSYTSPQEYEDRIRATLEIVRMNITKTFVNLVLIFNLSGVYNLTYTSDYCFDFHRILTFECSCLFQAGTIGDNIRQKMDLYAQEYNKRLRKIEADYLQKNFNDFAVIVQPYAELMNPAIYDLNFVSSIDCFHPSLKAQQAFAVALWNNMLTPLSLKNNNMTITDKPMCATEKSRLYTY